MLLALRGLLLLGLSLVPAGANAALATEDGSPCVLVLGDSISAAYGMSLEQGWVALVEERLRERWRTARVINASISGDTSGGGLRRLPALLEQHKPDLVVIELGGNDGLRGYPPSSLRDNLTSMATLAAEAGAAVVILPMEIPPNYGPRYTTAFRNAFAEAAADTDATLGPFPLDSIATQRELMQNDGIHPTVEAQPLIAERLLPVITAALIEEIAS